MLGPFSPKQSHIVLHQCIVYKLRDLNYMGQDIDAEMDPEFSVG